jgi:tryptophanyl-tRNA synthetase
MLPLLKKNITYITTTKERKMSRSTPTRHVTFWDDEDWEIIRDENPDGSSSEEESNKKDDEITQDDKATRVSSEEENEEENVDRLALSIVFLAIVLIFAIL